MMTKYGKTGAALLAAALLCTGGAVQAAEFTVNSQEDLTEENGWAKYDDDKIWAPTQAQGTSGNKVIIGSGETSQDFRILQISGAYSTTDAVSGNSVILESGAVNRLYGGYSENGIVTGNKATISGGIIDIHVYGGRSETGDAAGNTATIISGTVGECVYGGMGGGSATENTVTISGGEVQYDVVGGWSSEGSAERNTVTISGGTVTGSMYGAGVYGGQSSDGSAKDNTVTISGDGMVQVPVYGGYSKTGDASGNTVTLSGGTVKGSVYGGKSENGVVTGNTVTLTGTAVVSDAQLYGSNVSTENSGNKLVVDNWSGTVGGLHNFDSIEFQNVKLSEEDTTTSSLEVNGDVQGVKSNAVKVTSLAAGDYAADPDKTLTATITWDSDIQDAEADVRAVNGQKWFTADREEGGLYANQYDTKIEKNSDREVILKSSMTASALAGKFIDADGTAHYNSAYTPDENGTGQTLVIDNGFTTNVDTVAGAYAAGSQNTTGGQVLVTGNVNYAGTVYAGYSENGDAMGNTVTLSGATASQMNIYGGASASVSGNGKVSGNTLVVDGGSSTVGSLHNFDTIRFENVDLSQDTVSLTADIDDAMTGAGIEIDSFDMESLAAAQGKAPHTTTITWSDALTDGATFTENFQNQADSVTAADMYKTTKRDGGGVYAGKWTVTGRDEDKTDHKAQIDVAVKDMVLTNRFLDESGTEHTNETLALTDGFNTNVDNVSGVYAAAKETDTQDATGGALTISGTSGYAGNVYGGYAENGEATGNTITLKGATASQMNIYGGASASDGQVSGNTLIVDGGTENTVKSVQNFETITFQNLSWQNNGVALNIADAESANALADTSVQVDKLVLANGSTVQAGDKMTFIQSDKDTGLSLDKVSVIEDASFSQGVATVGELEMKLEGETNNLVGEIKGVGLNSQTTTIAENRTAAAAFLNQGADIAADSLDLLGTDYKYGLRTFGAVYGSRSTYDAAGDLKINGWSEIVGLGNVHRKGDGDLSWSIFYENGTGNYRTWNEFNNEMFRGDGSLLYNGGGAAVRYEKDNGWYYEASVRAGTLSASMDNAVKDGNGQSYGFDSDSTYWGAHAGVGKVIETEQGEWNVYGKYFHTDIDGDSFNIAGDVFTFDSLTSDRLRIGARYTADKAKRWSLYYGLAWEYEFSGDSHMKAGQWDAPEQSLGGSTGIAEIGTVWQPDDSPWQANINLKGYAGEREGVSGMVQLAYTF